VLATIMDTLTILPHDDKASADRTRQMSNATAIDDLDDLDKGKDVLHDEKVQEAGSDWTVPEDWISRFVDEYSGQHSGQSETLPPGSDPELTARAVLTFHQDEAVKLLQERVNQEMYDYNLDTVLFARMKLLVQGPEASGMEYGDWAYLCSKTAGFIHNWSPYAEVRAVTLPYDDPAEPCESARAYFLGFFWVIIVTAVNTCKSSRPML
jgi:hypothetical protein